MSLVTIIAVILSGVNLHNGYKLLCVLFNYIINNRESCVGLMSQGHVSYVHVPCVCEFLFPLSQMFLSIACVCM